MSPLHRPLVVAIGAYLFAVPFLRFAGAGHGGAAHMNHDARHGGQLGMVGDHHLELKLQDGVAEVFVSDARRVPLRPIRGTLQLDDARRAAMRWERYRMVARDIRAHRDIEVDVLLGDGTVLRTKFDVTEAGI